MLTFTFDQQAYDQSGCIRESGGHVAYRLHDEDDDHFLGGAFKDRPTSLIRTSDKKTVGSLKFGQGAKTVFKDKAGLFGRKGKKLSGWGGILDAE